MKSILVVCLAILLPSLTYSQYWFGPKVGVSYIDHVYQDKTYEKDSFNVSPNLNWQAGFALAYTASDMYTVYGELLYERTHKTVKDIETDGEREHAEMTNHFISAPIMLRVTLGRVPFHYYVNGGPRLAYWVGGKGTFFPSDDEEFWPLLDDDSNPLPLDYKLKFNSANASPGDFTTAYVSEPNRFQFGLTVGGGMYFDIQGGGRLQLDFRYTWQHSNMATNTSKDTNLIRGSSGDADYYRENLEYYHNIATIGIAYMFSYDSNLRRKGKSTSKESNKKKK
ncbi:outer membrane beta-barrel protein [Ekhidna sp.]|uniref:outer membrane beta-barrel protein n=1 Tax=Ekhidna sp. TaxID=2608089 RepID=UPI0035117081